MLCQRPVATRTAARQQVVCSAARPQQVRVSSQKAGLCAPFLAVIGVTLFLTKESADCCMLASEIPGLKDTVHLSAGTEAEQDGPGCSGRPRSCDSFNQRKRICS